MNRRERRGATRAGHAGPAGCPSRMLVGAVAAVALLIGSPGLAAAVPPPPPNPSDSQLDQAGQKVQQRIGQVSDLINRVASANQQLQSLVDQMQIKREAANKALVDLQRAQASAARAANAVKSAHQRVLDAAAAISQAQAQFDQFAAAGYQQGSTVGSLTAFLGSDGPGEILTRAEMLRVVTQQHESAMQQLERARMEEANKDSAARAAKRQADNAASVAQDRQSQAQSAIQAAVAAQQNQAQKKAEIVQQRNAAQDQLAQARQNVAGLQSQRQVYDQWEQQKKAEEAAQAAAAAAAKQAAQEAAAKVAADTAARERAAAVAKQQQQDLLQDVSAAVDNTNGNSDSSGNGDSSGGGDATSNDSTGNSASSGNSDGTATAKGSGELTSAEAIETVIARGMSQLGVRYSWGGGNAEGPTLGIHDGGVADSYGDYKHEGFDCSGLMVYAFAGAGVSLPHYSGYQYQAGEHVPVKDMKRGDMIFYGPNASEHVTLYLGNGMMLEAPESGEVVRVAPVRWNGIDPYVVRMFP